MQSRITFASLAQLAEHALRKRMVAGSIPAGGCAHTQRWNPERRVYRQFVKAPWREHCFTLCGSAGGEYHFIRYSLVGKDTRLSTERLGCEPQRRNESKVDQGRKKAYHFRQNVGLARTWVFDRVAGECSDLLALCRARRECGDPPAACFKQRDLIPNNDSIHA